MPINPINLLNQRELFTENIVIATKILLTRRVLPDVSFDKQASRD